jgi:hypothetical protein
VSFTEAEVADAAKADAEGRLHEWANWSSEELDQAVQTAINDPEVNALMAEQETQEAEQSSEQEPEVSTDSNETNRLKRKLAEYEKAERQRKEEEQRQAGEHDKVIAEREQRIQELEGQVAARERRDRVNEYASELRFRDSEEALGLLQVKGVDLDDTRAVKAALKGFSESKPHLLAPEEAPAQPGLSKVLENGSTPSATSEPLTPQDRLRSAYSQTSQ